MLRERGFTVHRLLNPSSGQFEKGFGEFVGAASTGPTLSGQSAIVPSGSVAPAASSGPEANSLYVFVFVGQAAQVNGQTRLGFSDSNPDAIETTTASLSTVASDLAARAAASVVVIDAAFTLNTGTATLRRQS
jgi:hypothetical protein